MNESEALSTHKKRFTQNFLFAISDFLLVSVKEASLLKKASRAVVAKKNYFFLLFFTKGKTIAKIKVFRSRGGFDLLFLSDSPCHFENSFELEPFYGGDAF